MPRPKNSSYRSHFQIHWRLLQGPLWLGDWKSTGLKSRSTVNNRLKHLYSMGLLQKNRQGHRIVYDFSKNATEATWDQFLKPKSFGKLWDKLFGPSSERNQKIETAIAFWDSNGDKPLIADFAKRFATGFTDSGLALPYPDFYISLQAYLNGAYCAGCLEKLERSIYVKDPSTQEFFCPKCGSSKPADL